MAEVGADSEGDESLVLPLPGALIASDQEHLPSEATTLVEALAAITPGAPVRETLAALEPTVREVLARWRGAEAAPDRLSPRQVEYDWYFRVRRAESSAPLSAFYDAVVVAYHRLLRESLNEHSLTPIEFGQLRAGLEGVLFRLRSPEPPVSVRCARPRPSPSAASAGEPLPPDRALRRWMRGHHAFFVLIQGLLLAHERLVRAMRAGQSPRIQAMLDWTIELWWAAAGAFRLAGDFDAQAYATVVRPSMSPPHVSEGFSGLHSADHTELIGMLKATRGAIEDRCVTHPAEHRSYLWALSSVYDSHVYVCEEFVGDGPSLKSSGSRYGSRATAVLAGPLKQRAMYGAGAPSAAGSGAAEDG
jgi:hypothetical protein